jgi:hypothetical protein
MLRVTLLSLHLGHQLSYFNVLVAHLAYLHSADVEIPPPSRPDATALIACLQITVIALLAVEFSKAVL